MHVPFPLSSREQALHLAFLWALLRFRLISCVLSFMPGRTYLFVMCMCEGNGVLYVSGALLFPSQRCLVMSTGLSRS